MQAEADTSRYIAASATPQSAVAKAQRRNKIIYWILTVLMFVPGTLGAFAEVFTTGPASIVKIMVFLGYPLYIMKILGIAKILGGIAILTGQLPRLKEWAYAGFAFDYLGATASHLIRHDFVYALFPFSFFLIMMYTYFLWYKAAATPRPFTQPQEEAPGTL